MDNTPYDENADNAHAPLQHAEQHPEEPHTAEGSENANENQTEGQALGKQETTAANDSSGGSEQKDNLKDRVGKGYTASKKKGKGVLGKISKSKKLLIAGAAGMGAGLLAAIIILFILASSLKLPNVTQNIIGYQFARLSRTFSQAGDKIADESFAKIVTKKLSQTALGQAAADKLQATKDKINNIHDQATGLKDGAIGTVKGIPGVARFLILNDTYNPLQVQKNLRGYGIEFDTDPRGQPVVTISGPAAEKLGIGAQTFLVEPPTGIGRFIPGYSEFLTAKSNNKLWNNSTIQQALKNAYETSGRLNSVPTIIRGAAMNSILKRIGINRAGLIISRFKNASDAKKQAQVLDEEINEATAPSKPIIPDSGPSGDAAQQAADDQQAAEQAAAADPTGEATAKLRSDDSTGVAAQVPEDLAKAASHGTVSAITRWVAGPVFNAMYLMCVFDEGANSGDNNTTMDTNNDANEKSFAELAAASDQLQRGPTSNDQLTAFDNASTAMSDKLGSDELYSVPLLRAQDASFDTSTEQAAQSTVYGFQTPKKAINNSFFWDFMKSIQGSCSSISSAWTAGGVALINLGVLLATIPTGGEGAEADAGLEAVSQSALKTIVGKVGTNLAKQFSENFGKKAGVKLAAKNAVTKSYKLFKQIIKNGVVVVGTESLGSMMAASHVPSLNHSGYETGNTYIAQADAGGNAVAQEQMRTMLFGRPLLKGEVCQSNALDTTYQQSAFKAQSAYQRYLAVKNPQSLLARTAIAVHANVVGSLGKPLTGLTAIISNPFGWLSSVFGYRAFADAVTNCDASTAFYGNLQIGWSQDEINLTNSDDSYKPDENMAILAKTGKAEAIAQKYGACFGYNYTGSADDTLTIDPAATVGYLLTGGGSDQPLVIRDEQGNVVNDDSAKCSPEYLSSASKDTALAADNVVDSNGQLMSPQRNDLIFRWRLAMKYTNVQNQLIAIQRAGGTSST